jgi:hypothetical protein
MGTDPGAEFLAQIARHKENTIEHSTALVKQSRRLIRIARGHDVDGGNNQTDGPISSEIRALTPSSQARETLRHCRLAK